MNFSDENTISTEADNSDDLLKILKEEYELNMVVKTCKNINIPKKYGCKS